MDGADLCLLFGDQLIERLGLRTGIGKVQTRGDPPPEYFQVFRQRHRGLHHVQTANPARIHAGQLPGEKIRLLLVVAFDADAVAAPQDGV